MKLLLLFLVTTIYADKNWIPITTVEQTTAPKPTTRLDVNLSQIKPINKMIKNVAVVKQLIDVTTRKEKPLTNSKNWFVLHSEDSK